MRLLPNTCPEASAPLSHRPVKEDFEFSKDGFGLDQSQVRLYAAIARHTVLVMAALAICAVTAALLKDRTDSQVPPPVRPGQAPPPDPGMIPLTVPEVRRLVAAATARPSPPGSATPGSASKTTTRPTSAPRAPSLTLPRDHRRRQGQPPIRPPHRPARRRPRNHPVPGHRRRITHRAAALGLAVQGVRPQGGLACCALTGALPAVHAALPGCVGPGCTGSFPGAECRTIGTARAGPLMAHMDNAVSAATCHRG